MAATELRGIVTAIRWTDPEGTGNVIAELRVEGNGDGGGGGKPKATVLGYDESQVVRKDAELLVLGEWREHPSRGQQFHAAAFIRVEPRTEAGTVRYLREIAGLSDGEARKCWRRWKERSIEVLRTSPATSSAVLGDVRASDIALFLTRNLTLQEARVGLATLFAGRRFPAGVIRACVDRCGRHAAEVIRRDPFLLLSLPHRPVGFKRADELYLACGGDPARLKRQTLLVMWTLSSNRDGHTWMAAADLADALEDYEGVGRTRARAVDAIRLGKRARKLVTRRDAQNRPWITTTERDGSEGDVAASVCNLLEALAPM
jgi:hypothetical protein